METETVIVFTYLAEIAAIKQCEVYMDSIHAIYSFNLDKTRF
jgi:hypothetical protein